MFEYKDNFLMNNSTSSVGGEDTYYLCCADSTAEDQLEELARLVGRGGSTPKSAPQEKTESITLLDDAPKLEYDLEEELSKAFASVPVSSQVQEQPVSETAALVAEVSTPAQPVVEPVQVEPQAVPQVAVPSQPVEPVQAEPQAKPAISQQVKSTPSVDAEDDTQDDLDLGDLISKEFELALQEEASQPEVDAEAGFVEAIDKATDTFDEELARLMGPDQESSDAAQTPPPMPELVVSPPHEAVIVKTAALPAVSEPEVPVSSVSDNIPAQMSDFDSPQVQSAVQEDFASAGTAPSRKEDSVAQPGEAAQKDTDDQSAAESATNAPIVYSEINLDVLRESNPPFHEEQISIPEPHAAVLAGGKRNTGYRAAGSLIAIALVAGVGLVGWNAMQGGGENVPTILASTEPVKVKPKDAGGTVVPNQDQAVYRSVESDKKVDPKQKSLADNSEKPMVVATNIGAGASKSETRIKRSELATGAAQPLKPRKVRTVVVKPDGTILTQSSGVKIEDPKLAIKSASAKPEPKATKLAVKTPEPAPKKLVAEKVEAKKVEAKKVEAKKVEAKKVVAKIADTKVAATEDAAKVKKPTKAKKPAPAKKTAAVKKPTPKKVVAAVKKPEPVKKAKTAKKQEPAKKKVESVKSTASLKSPYAVQVTSQRTPEAAERSYKSLARRYASVFRGKGMDIRKADIKGKGIYYRARIPAQSKASAREICRQLKSKGGDCFVTR